MRPVAKTDESDAGNEQESWWIRIALVLHWTRWECQQLDITHPPAHAVHYDTLPLRLCRLVFPGGEHSRARDIVINARFMEVSNAEWTSITAGKSKRFRSCNNRAPPPTPLRYPNKHLVNHGTFLSILKFNWRCTLWTINKPVKLNFWLDACAECGLH